MRPVPPIGVVIQQTDTAPHETASWSAGAHLQRGMLGFGPRRGNRRESRRTKERGTEGVRRSSQGTKRVRSGGMRRDNNMRGHRRTVILKGKHFMNDGSGGANNSTLV